MTKNLNLTFLCQVVGFQLLLLVLPIHSQTLMSAKKTSQTTKRYANSKVLIDPRP